MKSLLYFCFITLFFNCSALNKLNFNFKLYKTNLLTETSIHLKNAKTDIELFNSKTSKFNKLTLLIESNFDTILEFNKTFDLPLPKDNYELQIYFNNEKIGSRTLDYAFTLEGNESKVEILLQLNIFKKLEKGVKNHCLVEVFKYLKSTHGIKVLYFSDVNENQQKRDPFFKVQSNSRDTLYFGRQSLSSPSPSKIKINNHTFDHSGGVDYNIIRKTPLLPDSIIKISLKNMYWRLDWPEDRYTYILLYYTKEKQIVGVKKLSEDPNFIWYGNTNKYFRFTYTFDMK